MDATAATATLDAAAAALAVTNRDPGKTVAIAFAATIAPDRLALLPDAVDIFARTLGCDVVHFSTVGGAGAARAAADAALRAGAAVPRSIPAPPPATRRSERIKGKK